MSKPNLVLLDCDIIIFCHQLGVWEQLKTSSNVAVASTVAHEARYFRSQHGNKSIDIGSQITRKEIQCLEATAAELAGAVRDFARVFVAALQYGELEAIALLISGRFEGWLFCTGDRIAMQAVAMLGLSDRIISFEKLLTETGLKGRITGRLNRALSEETLQYHLDLGKTRRVTREYFIS